MPRQRFDHKPPNEVGRLGLFETTHTHELNVRATGPWRFNKHSNTLACRYRLSGTRSALDEKLPLWSLEINRPPGGGPRSGLAKFFIARVVMFDEESENPRDLTHQVILRGYCRSWVEAVESVRRDAPFIDHMRESAVKVYGASNSPMWGWVRPFSIKYPFKRADEPNAIYSEFNLVGGWEFDAEVDGAICCSYGIDPKDAAKMTAAAGGNAFLLAVYQTDGSINYRLYHRNGMAAWDPWDIDNWRGRIIAGTRDF
jgi:hypothetical protein